MDKRREIIETLKIGIEHEIIAIIDLGAISAEEHQTLTQSYLLLQMLDTLERMDKTLNLIAAYTNKGHDA